MTSRTPTAATPNPGQPACTLAATAVMGVVAILIMLPVTIVVPALKELVGDRFAAGSFWTHGFMSINMIGAALTAPLVALFADRVGRRTLVAIALVCDGGMFGAMAMAPSLTVLLSLRFLEGAFHILALSSLMALAADYAPMQKRGRTMGILGSCMMLGTAIGTRLGGAVWRVFPDAVFESAGTIAFASAALAWLCLPIARQVHTARGPGIVSVLRVRPGLSVAFAFTFVDRFCVGVIISSFVLFLALAHDLDPDARSRQLVLFLAPFAILIYPVGRLIDRFGAVAPLVGGSIGFGCLFASYGFVPTGALPIVMVASGVLSAMMFAPTLTLCTDLAPPGRRGAAYAGFNAAGSLGFIAGPLTAGAICHSLLPHWGAAAAYRTAFIVAGACQVACAVIALRWLVAMVRRGEIRSGGATPKTGRSVSHQAEIPVA